MTVVQSESKAPSRRAVLAGALGGIGALAVTVIGRADPVRAEGQPVVVGGEYLDATSTTFLQNLTTADTVFYGASSSGIGVEGSSLTNNGVYGVSSATSHAGCLGYAPNDATGVQGASGGSLPSARSKTGVYGYANQDNTANGVFGESPTGRAIAGYSSSGYAGYFSGRVFTSRWLEMAEVTTPASPSANRARLFVRDSAGKTQLAVKFPNGTVRVLATEA